MTKPPPEEVLSELLETLKSAMGLDAEVEVRWDGDVLVGALKGEDLGLFIGRRGQTIDAVQHLAQRILSGDREGERIRVMIDAADYRAHREEVLQRQADEAAEDALRTDKPVALTPMPASERKIVHTHLAARGDVETFSEGEEPERRLVVAPLSN